MAKQYENLIAQLNRLHRHNRQGSYRTRARYYEAMQRFCRFLANRYGLERLANIAPKHLIAYILYLQESGKAPSTIKTDLAAIRFYHDIMSAPRYTLPDNGELCLQQRTILGVDRTWSVQEFEAMLRLASELGREDYVTIFMLGWYEGLRIHECFRIDTATAAQALREQTITIKGKGGLVRTLPLNPILKPRFRYHLERRRVGAALCPGRQCPPTRPSRPSRLSSMFTAPTPRIRTPRAPCTFHGLRHTCAARWYDAHIQGGRFPLCCPQGRGRAPRPWAG